MTLNQGPGHGSEDRVEGKKHGSQNALESSFIFETHHATELLSATGRL